MAGPGAGVVNVMATAGLDTRIAYASPNSASELTNMRWASDFGGFWSSDLGWEPLIPDASLAGRTWSPAEFSPCRMLSAWRDWLLMEHDGELSYRWWAQGAGSVFAPRVVLATGRYVPGPNEAATQLVDCGRFALVLNGHDEPIKWWGGRRVTPFGFASAPSAPQCNAPDPDYWNNNIISPVTWQTAEAQSLGFPVKGDGGGAPPRSNDFEPALGLGIAAASAISSYDYARTFVSETGSESALSERTTPVWQQPALAVPSASYRRLGVTMDLSGGPDNAVGQRIYRTGNRRTGTASELSADATLYLVATIDQAGDMNWCDVVPDLALVGQPQPLNSIPLPPGLRLGAMYDGRLWLTDGRTLWWTERSDLERIPVGNSADLAVAGGGSGSSNAGEATALVVFGRGLVVMRERGLLMISPSTAQTAVSPYAFAPLSGVGDGGGTLSPNAVVVVPGVGMVWLGTDGGVYRWSGDRNSPPASISSAIDSIKDARVTLHALPRAWGVYAPLEREVWFHVPVDGETWPTLGFVIHVEPMTKADVPVWSLRGWMTRPGDAGAPVGSLKWRTCFTSACVLNDGHLLLGTGPFNLDGPQAPDTVSFPLNAAHRFFNLGVQVWTRAIGWGRMTTGWVAVAAQPADWWAAATRTDGSADESVLASAWVMPPEVEHGGATRRSLFAEAVILDAGPRTFVVQSGVDGMLGDLFLESTPTTEDPNQTSTTDQLLKVFSAAEAPASTTTRRDGLWATAKAGNYRLIRVRKDLSMRVGSRRSCRIRLSNAAGAAPAALLGVVGVSLTFGSSGVLNPTGRSAGTGGGSP